MDFKPIQKLAKEYGVSTTIKSDIEKTLASRLKENSHLL
ncbi:hypothetical protein M983_2286 [Proteus myxofaciens ATCC 19692]|uniref:Uncharacterized protein n=1 Tax=Proteus myxofaciens ATCC 19692 TaxID=1354337 RepID=A0A198FLQ6_9GAMM|nr:hypothetical protein M983_2286 [Proteus myxofaciens ATCC 19692]